MQAGGGLIPYGLIMFPDPAGKLELRARVLFTVKSPLPSILFPLLQERNSIQVGHFDRLPIHYIISTSSKVQVSRCLSLSSLLFLILLLGKVEINWLLSEDKRLTKKPR